MHSDIAPLFAKGLNDPYVAGVLDLFFLNTSHKPHDIVFRASLYESGDELKAQICAFRRFDEFAPVKHMPDEDVKLDVMATTKIDVGQEWMYNSRVWFRTQPRRNAIYNYEAFVEFYGEYRESFLVRLEQPLISFNINAN